MSGTVFEVPDLVLRDAYLLTARKVGKFRENFCNRTENLHEVRQVLGPQYAHVPIDDLKDQITLCSKAPEKHGGGWAGKNGHGPSKLPPSPAWYQQYIRDTHFLLFREKVLEFWGYRCAVCNSSKPLEVHHRTYERLHKERIEDCIALCHKCHKRHHKWMSIPEKQLAEHSHVGTQD